MYFYFWQKSHLPSLHGDADDEKNAGEGNQIRIGGKSFCKNKKKMHNHIVHGERNEHHEIQIFEPNVAVEYPHTNTNRSKYLEEETAGYI